MQVVATRIGGGRDWGNSGTAPTVAIGALGRSEDDEGRKKLLTCTLSPVGRGGAVTEPTVGGVRLEVDSGVTKQYGVSSRKALTTCRGRPPVPCQMTMWVGSTV